MHEKENVLLTVQDLSKSFGFSEAWIRRMIFHKKIPFYKVEGLIRFNLEEVRVWIRDQKVGGKNE
jgi:excisionase family DNA binding protein